MKHHFIPSLPLYCQCPSCGFVDEIPDTSQKDLPKCQGCQKEMLYFYKWFPDFIFDYVIILEDYHFREPTQLRQDYFKAIAMDNSWEYWCSTTEPEFKPTNDWKPITILLFRSIFEILLEHFLWKKIWVNILPSPDAERYADLILESAQTVNRRIDFVYPRVTGNRWNDDLEKLGCSELNKLLTRAARVRNEFIHTNPYAGHDDFNLAEEVRLSIPTLFDCFVKLANLYIHPRCITLSKLKWEEE